MPTTRYVGGIKQIVARHNHSSSSLLSCCSKTESYERERGNIMTFTNALRRPGRCRNGFIRHEQRYRTAKRRPINHISMAAIWINCRCPIIRWPPEVSAGRQFTRKNSSRLHGRPPGGADFSGG